MLSIAMIALFAATTSELSDEVLQNTDEEMVVICEDGDCADELAFEDELVEEILEEEEIIQ